MNVTIWNIFVYFYINQTRYVRIFTKNAFSEAINALGYVILIDVKCTYHRVECFSLALNLEKRHFVNFIETGVITTKTHHKLVVYFVVYAAFVLPDKKVMICPVRCRTVHSLRIQIDRADSGRGADFVFNGPFFYYPIHTHTHNITRIENEIFLYYY